MRKPYRILFGSIGIIVAITAILTHTGFPPYIKRCKIYISTYEVCQYCGAGYSHKEVMGFIPTKRIIQDNDLSRYIHTISPNHKHEWTFCGSQAKSLYGMIYADGAGNQLPPLNLKKAALPILKSFPDNKSRLAFWNKLYAPTKTHTLNRHPEIWKATTSLRHAYEDNPHRRDWQQLIKKLDLAPKIKEGK